MPRSDSSTATDTVRPPKRWWVLSVVAVLVATLGVGLGLVLPAMAVSPLKDGRGTATFTWHDVTDELNATWRQPFTGTVDGLAIKGTLSPKVTHSGGAISIGFDITGTMAGAKFVLVLQYLKADSLRVTGHFDNLAVTGTIKGSANEENNMGTMNGTVGPYRITGQIRDPVRHGKVTTASDIYDVSGG